MAKTAAPPAAEVIRKPLMSGHCAGRSLTSANGLASHQRCQRNGGGQRANPEKQFQPCPCPCHYNTDASGEPAEIYECGGCGREIMEAWYWPLDEDGETRYTHIDGLGRALGEECATTPAVSRNREPDPVRDCTRCGDPFEGQPGLCPNCRAEDEAAAEADDDFSDLDFDDDDFSDLDDL